MENVSKQLTAQRVRLDIAKKATMKVLPNSRGKSLAYTALEKGRMWMGEVCRELGKEYPYEATKKATTAEGIQDAVDVVGDSEVAGFLDKGNEITNLNDLRELLEREEEAFTKTISAIAMPNGIDKFKMDCAVSEAYRGLKEARMWMGIRLGELRDAHVAKGSGNKKA